MKHAFLAILLIILIPSVAAAECELFERFEYSYTNNDEITHRVTFVLLNKSSEDMRVIFEPSTLIVLPGESGTFAATARSDEPLEGIQSAGFAIRRGVDVVAYATAYFDLSCPEEPVVERPLWRDVLFYAAIVLIVIILILALVLWLLERRTPSAPSQKTLPESVSERTARAPINVDAMIRAEREEKASFWWLWVLAAIIILVVIGVFIYLAVSGAGVEGFNFGSMVNVTE